MCYNYFDPGQESSRARMFHRCRAADLVARAAICSSHSTRKAIIFHIKLFSCYNMPGWVIVSA